MTSLPFPANALTTLASSLLNRAGARPEDADLVARSLVAADRAGVYSHGLLRLPLYLRAVEAGGIDPTSTPQVLRSAGAVSVIDGHGAFGQVTMQRAVDTAAQTAREHGIAAVAVQGSTHYGAGRFWTDQLATQGIAAILTSSTGPVATPFGGSSAILGTNPLTLSLPSAEDGALVADLATTQGAYGKVVAARDDGADVPPAWGVDSSAQPTTDPAAILDGGALLPFGGHKGSGISVLLEGLATALTSAHPASRTVDIWQDPSSRMNTGHLLIALDLGAFGDPDAIRAAVGALQGEVRSSGPEGEVHSPGDLEHDRAAASPEAIALSAATAQELRALAEISELDFPAPLAPSAEEGSR